MVYLVTKADALLRYCAHCALVRSMFIGVADDATIVACCVCATVQQRVEHASPAAVSSTR